MNSPISSKTLVQRVRYLWDRTLGPGLALIAAVSLFQATSVLAAEPVGDAQMQASDLLSGTVGGHPRTVDVSAANPAAGHQTSSLEPQEQARQLILGKPSSAGLNGRAAALEPTMNATPAGSAQDRDRTYPDPQESARRMILGEGASAPASKRSVSLTQEPLVMRLDKDEFRIAFGINVEGSGSNGGNGVIRYRVDWKAEDGTARSEIKRVGYNVLPGTSRTITVDHQYFDTTRGAHTTDVVKVSVDQMTYLDSRALLTASIGVQAAPPSVVRSQR